MIKNLLLLISAIYFCSCAAMMAPNLEDCHYDSACLEAYHSGANTKSHEIWSESEARPDLAKDIKKPQKQNFDDALLAISDFLIAHNKRYIGLPEQCNVISNYENSITISCGEERLPKQIDLRRYGWNGYAKMEKIEIRSLVFNHYVQTYLLMDFDENISSIENTELPSQTYSEPIVYGSYKTKSYGDVYVSGHYRTSKSGKVSYVKPHFRSRPGTKF